MNTFVKVVRILLVVSAVAGFLGKTLYAGLSGLSFASVLGEGIVFGLMTPIVIGTLCSFIWLIAGSFLDKSKDNRTRGKGGC
ncbi:MAG: hypothetical protein LBS97_03405 [Treponema sp.]|nr:hypothetical protein [Treponema sp.]